MLEHEALTEALRRIREARNEYPSIVILTPYVSGVVAREAPFPPLINADNDDNADNADCRTPRALSSPPSRSNTFSGAYVR